MHLFQLYGFITKVIVCDGASNNLAAIKTLTGFGSGAYGNSHLEAVRIFTMCNPGSQTPTQIRKCSSSSVPLIRINLKSILYCGFNNVAKEHGECPVFLKDGKDKEVHV